MKDVDYTRGNEEANYVCSIYSVTQKNISRQKDISWQTGFSYKGTVNHSLHGFGGSRSPRIRRITLSTDSAGELNVLGHDGDTLGVNGGTIGVLEDADQVIFGCLLEGLNSGCLEAESFNMVVLG